MKKLHYLNVDHVKWARYYQLSLEPRPCDKCGKLLYPTIPYIYQDWRGLSSASHECSPNYDLNIVRSLKSGREWSFIYDLVSELGAVNTIVDT